MPKQKAEKKRNFGTVHRLNRRRAKYLGVVIMKRNSHQTYSEFCDGIGWWPHDGTTYQLMKAIGRNI